MISKTELEIYKRAIEVTDVLEPKILPKDNAAIRNWIKCKDKKLNASQRSMLFILENILELVKWEEGLTEIKEYKYYKSVYFFFHTTPKSHFEIMNGRMKQMVAYIFMSQFYEGSMLEQFFKDNFVQVELTDVKLRLYVNLHDGFNNFNLYTSDKRFDLDGVSMFVLGRIFENNRKQFSVLLDLAGQKVFLGARKEYETIYMESYLEYLRDLYDFMYHEEEQYNDISEEE